MGILFVPNLFLIMHFKDRTSLLFHKTVEIFSFPVPRTFIIENTEHIPAL